MKIIKKKKKVNQLNKLLYVTSNEKQRLILESLYKI